MKIVATIEARINSSRLPGKTMMKIVGKPMLELMIERIKNSKMLEEIIRIMDFNSASALKNEIRKKIRSRANSNWILLRMESRGSIISLKFITN